ncbi:hypothetical protein LTR10_002464 [Elasticomyces elasticus]|nr:hypothetical protein LTR10_002464 [Elasticomyces elasticus]KAK4973472.1 hypothetical protein LTR42_005460 [Elasticomyces elasticus]
MSTSDEPQQDNNSITNTGSTFDSITNLSEAHQVENAPTVSGAANLNLNGTGKGGEAPTLPDTHNIKDTSTTDVTTASATAAINVNETITITETSDDAAARLEAFRKENDFNNTHIIEDTQRDESVPPPVRAPVTIKIKRKRSAEEDGGAKAPPVKKMRSNGKSSVIRSIEGAEGTRRSDRNMKRRSSEITSDEAESPLAKKAKTSTVADQANSTPDSQRRTGITSSLRKNGLYPKKHTSSTLAVKHVKTTPIKYEDEDSAPDLTDPDTPPPRKRTDSSKKSASKRRKRSGDGKKKQAPPAIPPDFVGTTSGNGHSVEKPSNGTLDKPWNCAVRACTSGMTWLPRDGKALGKGMEGFGRKNVSQFFGRNKRETGFIADGVWHIYCRKCYQTKFYAACRMASGAFGWHINNTDLQFDRLRLWRPNALFNVRLTKNAKAKIEDWHKTLRKHNGNVQAAKGAFDKDPTWGKKAPKPKKKGQAAPQLKPEDVFPADIGDQFETDCCGDDFTYDRIDEVIQHIKSLYAAGTLRAMPPIEFLIHEIEDGEVVNDSASNYQRWVATCDGTEYNPLEEEGDYIKAEESDGSDIRVAGADDDDETEDDEDDDNTRDMLMGAVAEADSDDEDGGSESSVNIKEESSPDLEVTGPVVPPRQWTPFSVPKKQGFPLTAAGLKASGANRLQAIKLE